MIRKLLLLLCAWFVFAMMTWAQSNRPYESVPEDPLGVRIYTLGNGMKVYLSANHEIPSIHTYIAVRAGGKNDPAETTGLAHYLEHLLFKGTTHFGTLNYTAEKPLLDSISALYEIYRHVENPEQRKALYHKIDSISNVASHYAIANEYDRLMSGIGALGTNAATTQDATYYIENIPSNEIEQWATVESERFQNMVIRGFHTELESVYEEYNLGLTDDVSKSSDSLFAMLFPGHPYGTQTVIGLQQHLKNPSIVNIEQFFNRYYIPSNMAIIMSGDLDYDKTIEIIDKHFGSWTKGSPLPATVRTPLPPIVRPKTSTVYGPTSDMVFVAWRMPCAADSRADLVKIINPLLENGRAGLFNIDLELQQKIINPSADNWLMAEQGALFAIGEPKEGQTLDEVKQILLDEVDKLAKGDFSDDLLKAVIDNLRLDRMKNIEHNEQRADMMLDAYVNHVDWKDVVNEPKRLEHITRQDIMDFAKQWITDSNYVCVYKRQGEDSTIVKIEKPLISPIEMNRDKTSDFVQTVMSMPIEPIKPAFVDFKKDLSITPLKKGNKLYYQKNKQNKRFTLKLIYERGIKADPYLPSATQYMDLLGTKKHSAEALRQAFYLKTCSLEVEATELTTEIKINGLAEYQDDAIRLLNEWLWSPKADKSVFDEMLADEETTRIQNKSDIETCYERLETYVQYGPQNAYTILPTVEQMRKSGPKRLLRAIRALKNNRLIAFYYGPSDLEDIQQLLEQEVEMPKNAVATDVVKNSFAQVQTPQNEVYLAPFDSKAIRMGLYSNDGKVYDPSMQPIITLYNEYFDGNMNTVLFQEMRESRGLVYSVDASYKIPWHKDGNNIYDATMSTQNDKMSDCMDVMSQILDTLPALESSFQLAKRGVIKQMASERFHGEGLLEYVYGLQLLGLDHDIDRDVFTETKKFTLDDLVQFARKNVAGRKFRYLILGNEKDLDMDKLKAIGPIHKLSLTDIFGY